MANRISQRQVVSAPFDASQPTNEPKPIDYWTQPKGLNYTARLSRLGTEFAAQIQNMRLFRGVLTSRPGSVVVGSSSTDIVDVVNFTTDNGVGYLLRFRTTTVELFDGTNWTSIAGTPTFTGGMLDKWSFTSFGNQLYFTNGMDGIYRFDPSNGTISLVTEAPNAKYIATFAGRIVASFVNEPNQIATRIQWSARNNSLVWDAAIDPGAGFEDLLSVPGGVVDAQRGVWPISDTVALVVRSNSVWSMTETGLVDAPFRFSRIYSQVGNAYPYSIADLPGSIIGLFDDNVYLMSDQNIQRIGDTIKDQLVAELATTMYQPRGTFDSFNYEYHLAFGPTVYTYHTVEGGWTRRVYDDDLQGITYAKSTFRGLTIDTALGTFDNPLNDVGDPEDGSVDSEVALDRRLGVFFSTSTQVYKDDPTAVDDAGVDPGIEVWTGLLQSGSVRERTRLVEVQIEYEADEAQTLLFETSVNQGSTWQSYGTWEVDVTSGPQIGRVYRALEGHNVQLRIRSVTLGILRLLSVTPFVSVGARVRR